MTKSEFIQRVAIALAGNPKFAGDSTLAIENIVHEAYSLAEQIECHPTYVKFEERDETALHCIADELYAIRLALAGEEDSDSNIRDILDNIRRYMNNPNDSTMDLSTLQEIAKSVWDIEGHQRSLSDLHVVVDEE